ncbi:hypothetical protein [Roseinatronobacter sp. S2]|nr:hypothetical protein [Roseinatronobacter sp. S2]WFE73529.1 hypothetical protein P8S53_10030 [Roseinatronobacter sp. S2]
MSKFTILAAFGAVLALGACAKHQPAPEPAPAPIMVEPVSTKG